MAVYSFYVTPFLVNWKLVHDSNKGWIADNVKFSHIIMIIFNKIEIFVTVLDMAVYILNLLLQ